MSAEERQSLSDWRERRLAIVFFFAIAILLGWAMTRVLAPFITPILLAAIVTTFTYPFYRRLRDRLGGRSNVAAILMLVIVTVTIILPAFVLILLLIDQATVLIRLIQNADVGAMSESLRIEEHLSRVRTFLPWIEPEKIQIQEMVVGTVEQIPGWMATYGGAFLASMTNVAIGFLFMLLAAYYFYVEGESLVEEIKVISPLPGEYENEIFQRFRGVVNATFRGQILTAVAQGAVTAIGLLIAGVPGAIFWGAVAAIFSLIPMVGAAAVWLPAAIYLFAMSAIREAPVWPAIFLTIWGVAVVSVVDNLIRPWAMREGTKMSAILLFFSILGGIRAFGIIGLILGPLVFALFVTVVHMYKYFFHAPIVSAEAAPIEPDDGATSSL